MVALFLRCTIFLWSSQPPNATKIRFFTFLVAQIRHQTFNFRAKRINLFTIYATKSFSFWLMVAFFGNFHHIRLFFSPNKASDCFVSTSFLPLKELLKFAIFSSSFLLTFYFKRTIFTTLENAFTKEKLTRLQVLWNAKFIPARSPTTFRFFSVHSCSWGYSSTFNAG